MNSVIKVVIWISLISFVLCSWEDPIKVYTGKGYITNLDTYGDNSTGIEHYVFSLKKNNNFSFGYLNLDSDNNVSEVIWLSKDISGSSDSITITITGAHDGKHIYVAMVMWHISLDVYFVESADGGKTWSKPVLTRSNNIDERVHRMMPRIFYVDKVGLQLFYYRNDNYYILTTVQKKFGNDSWGEEQIWKVPTCNYFFSGQGIDMTTVEKKDGSKVLVMAVNCVDPYSQIITGESKDNGETWKFYSKSLMKVKASRGQVKIISSNSRKGTAHISFIGARFTADVRLMSTYEYMLEGKFEEILQFPMYSTYCHSINYKQLNNTEYLLTFAGKTPIKHDNGARIMLISLDEPWKQFELPLPTLTYAIDYQVHSYSNNKLLLSGIIEGDTIKSQRYNFD